MSASFRRCPVPWLPLGLALTFGGATSGTAQGPPDPSPFAQNLPPLPSTSPQPPSPAAEPAAAPAAETAAAPAAGVSSADYEARIQQLEAIVRQMQAQQAAIGATGGAAPAGGAAAGIGGPITGDADPGTPVGRPGAPTGGTVGAGAVTPSASGGASAPGQSFPPNPPSNKRFDSPATLESRPGKVKFGPGFEIKTDDEEFLFQFHNLTQFDYRGYEQGGQNPVHNTFVVPRQWYMFSGRITRPIGYFVSISQGQENLGGLDYFIDLNYDPRIQARIGRMKTPFTYEFFVEPVQGLITPERSLFFNNFGQNRDVGAMAYGRLWGGLLDYAAGVYNGSRNGFVASQDSKFFSGFFNTRPFKDAEGSILENFNIGGSVFTGTAYNSPTIPQTLRTAVATSGNGVLGVPFLTFNNNVRETGNQAFWDLHTALFYNHLAVVAEWQTGAQDYALTSSANNRSRVGVDSYYVQAGYLLTGETRSSTGIVKPLRPFDLRNGQRGPGAWEPTFRYNYMGLNGKVFGDGLVDPNNSANSLHMTDIGFNWHLTQYMKLYFDWQHAEYNQPVLFAPGRRQSNSDLFLVRFQLYF